MFEDISNIFQDIFYGSNSPGFYKMLIVAIICSLIINLLALYISSLVLHLMCDNRIEISKFIVGLIILYSFAPSIKVNLISWVGSWSIFQAFLFYLVQLTPLYILFYILTFSFIGLETFSLISHYEIGSLKLSKYLLKKIKIAFLIFLGFSIIYITFDNTKIRIDSKLFNFSEIVLKHPYLTQINPEFNTLSHVSPVLLLTLLLLTFYLIKRRVLGKRLSVNQNYKVISFAISESPLMNFKFISGLKISSISRNIIIRFPYIILAALIIVYLTKFLFYFDLKDKLSFVLKTDIKFAIIICIITAILSSLLMYSLAIYNSIYIVLFCTALMPQTIIGYSISGIFTSYDPSFKLLLSYFFCFGIFPFYFFSTYFKENASGFIYSKHVGGFFKSIKHIYEISKEPFKLAFGLILLLEINDSAIIDSIAFPSGLNKSFSYTLYNLQINSSGSNSLEFLNNVSWLIFLNVLIILILPIIFQLIKSTKKIFTNFSM